MKQMLNYLWGLSVIVLLVSCQSTPSLPTEFPLQDHSTTPDSTYPLIEQLLTAENPTTQWQAWTTQEHQLVWSVLFPHISFPEGRVTLEQVAAVDRVEQSIVGTPAGIAWLLEMPVVAAPAPLGGAISTTPAHTVRNYVRPATADAEVISQAAGFDVTVTFDLAAENVTMPIPPETSAYLLPLQMYRVVALGDEVVAYAYEQTMVWLFGARSD